ncbi:MAG: PASTA domain-containing protein [Gemmatimonadales bacterium]|nr:MAG: PASTA domain-containing protein [Gemmatimonadales bacterium]
MRLGSSIRRRRGSGGKGPSWKGFFPGLLRTRSGEGPQWWRNIADIRTLQVLALLSLVGFVGGYLFSTRVVYPVPPPPGDLSVIPNLTGELPEDAADTLAAMGLILGTVDSLNHPTAPAGRIVGQSPLPGQLSLVGDTVRVALSTGPEQRPVPDVLRLNADWARTVLETAGFVVEVDSVEADAPPGRVVAMTPEPGTEARIPLDVRISVSMGPPEFEMPLLLGLSEEQARSVLDSLGLILSEVETRFRFGRDQGLVVEQEPPASATIQEGASVRLVVGRRGQ